MAGASRIEQTRVAVRGLARFASGAGWPTEVAVLTREDLIEAFCAQGLAGATSATRGTYRSVLRAWAGLADGGRARRGPGYRGARAARPYTLAERAEPVAVAAAQSCARRCSARVMAGAGLGAGLTASELLAVRGTDVHVDGGGVVVSVAGRRTPVVPVTAPYDAMLAELAAAAGQAWLFRPQLAERGYKNAVCNVAETLVADPAGPAFRLGRARASFICDHIAAAAPVARLLEITGLVEAGSLTRYAAHVNGAPTSKGAWRARLAAEQQRS